MSTTGKILGVYPEGNYAAVDTTAYGSVTFSLESGWESEYPPETGDMVVLESVYLHDKGWRAKAARLLTTEVESTLLPLTYPDTALGRILQKWDSTFFFSLPLQAWESDVKIFDLKVDLLRKILCGQLGGNLKWNDRMKARAILLLLSYDVRSVPFSVPSRHDVASLFDLKVLKNPFTWTDPWYRGLGSTLNILEIISDQLFSFVVDAIIEYVSSIAQKLADGSDNGAWYEGWLKWYLELIPFVIQTAEKRLPEKVPTLVALYNLEFLYDMNSENPFEKMLQGAQRVEIILPLLDRMENYIDSFRYRSGWWRKFLAEYALATTPVSLHKGNWKDSTWRRAVGFLIAQKAPYELFNLEQICNLLVQQRFSSENSRFDEGERSAILRLIGNYLVLGNSSWRVHDSLSLTLTKWVIQKLEPENQVLKEEVQRYTSR